MVLAGDNYTGFAARSGTGRDAMPRKARKLEEEERERDRQMLAEVEFIGR